jgi:hypothetical protein
VSVPTEDDYIDSPSDGWQMEEMQDGRAKQAMGGGNARVSDARGSGGRPADAHRDSDPPMAAAQAGGDDPPASGHPSPERGAAVPSPGNTRPWSPDRECAAVGAALGEFASHSEVEVR